jgi:hypothetical protein
VTAAFTEAEFPAVRESADRASASAQRTFLQLSTAQLALLSLTAFIAGLGVKTSTNQRLLAWSIFGTMLLTLCVASALRIGRFDDRWFRCRAYAENFKSIVWRYVMSAHCSDRANITKYLDETRQLSARLPELQKEFARFSSSETQLITEWMRTAQALTLPEKLKLYRASRLDDQISWYSNKARLNAQFETRWFWAAFVIEFSVIVLSLIQASTLMEFNPVGGIAAVGTAVIAWSQIKRFSDLGTSYAIAAEDLRQIAATHQDVSTQDELDLLVQEVETAVSREHSMWLARRIITC